MLNFKIFTYKLDYYLIKNNIVLLSIKILTKVWFGDTQNGVELKFASLQYENMAFWLLMALNVYLGKKYLIKFITRRLNHEKQGISTFSYISIDTKDEFSKVKHKIKDLVEECEKNVSENNFSSRAMSNDTSLTIRFQRCRYSFK